MTEWTLENHCQWIQYITQTSRPSPSPISFKTHNKFLYSGLFFGHWCSLCSVFLAQFWYFVFTLFLVFSVWILVSLWLLLTKSLVQCPHVSVLYYLFLVTFRPWLNYFPHSCHYPKMSAVVLVLSWGLHAHLFPVNHSPAITPLINSPRI